MTTTPSPDRGVTDRAAGRATGILWRSMPLPEARRQAKALAAAGLLAHPDDGLPYAPSDYAWQIDELDQHSARVTSRGLSPDAARETVQALRELGTLAHPDDGLRDALTRLCGEVEARAHEDDEAAGYRLGTHAALVLTDALRALLTEDGTR